LVTLGAQLGFELPAVEEVPPLSVGRVTTPLAELLDGGGAVCDETDATGD
jgi:hypothetical protein